MFRALLCTAALTLALTASHAEAGKFSIHLGGGGNHSGISFNNHHNNNHCYNNNCHRYPPVYHAPVVTCYYQVCYFHPDWVYKQHKCFTCLHDAQAFAYQVQLSGCYASISKTCTPYYAGPQLLVPGHAPVQNAWMP